MAMIVRRLQGNEWEAWRQLRLRALEDAPYAFSSTFERDSALPDEEWRDRTTALAISAERAMFVVEDGEQNGPVASAGVFREPGGSADIVITGQSRRRPGVPPRPN